MLSKDLELIKIIKRCSVRQILE